MERRITLPHRRGAAIMVMAALSLICSIAAAQTNADADRQAANERRTEEYRRQPLEFLDDPYRSAVPRGAVPQTSPGRTSVRGSFSSVQVNVTATGENIVGDAANEPSIAIDPTNPSRMVIGWRQFDTIASNFRQAGMAYSHDAGRSWTFPGVLQPGQFRSDPILAADSDGTFYYYSLSTVTSAEMFKSVDGGVSWSGPTPGRGGDKAWTAIDRTPGVGNGHIYAQWNRSFSCCFGDFTRSTDRGGSFISPRVVPNSPFWGTMSVGPDGALYISGNGMVVVRSDNAQNSAAIPGFDSVVPVSLGGNLVVGTGPNPVGLLGQAWLATDHSGGPTHGNVYLLASVLGAAGDPLDIKFARSEDRGETWSLPVRVNDDAVGNAAWQWFGTMSVAPNGRIDVVWNDTRNDPGAIFSELHYSFSLNGGITWSVNVPVSQPFNHFLGYPQQSKIGDYYHAISDDFGMSVAYAATFNGEQDVYHLRINVDCNGNGIPDEIDLAPGGGSFDTNGNQTPDECEAGAPLPAAPPHDIPKNRFVSFAPNQDQPVAHAVIWRKLTCSQSGLDCLDDSECGEGESCTHVGSFPIGWVGEPVDASTLPDSVAPLGTFVATIVAGPVVSDWTGIDTVHLRGCRIAPVKRYEISATANPATGLLSEPLTVETAGKPEGKFWADMVGHFDGVSWSRPNGLVNVDDVLAMIKFIILQPAPHVTVLDLHPETANVLINASDLQMVLQQGFQGKAYPPPPFPNQGGILDCPPG